MLSNFIAQTLDSLGQTSSLPVFVKSPSRGNLFLGLADHTHSAETLGLTVGIACSKISTATLPGDDRRFYVLHWGIAMIHYFLQLVRAHKAKRLTTNDARQRIMGLLSNLAADQWEQFLNDLNDRVYDK